MPLPRVFAAIADPVRRAILERLNAGGATAGEIAAQFEVSWPAISRHLRLLREAGLVWETRDGRTRFYEVNRAGVSAASDWLAQFRSAPGRPQTGSPITSAVGREYSS